MNPAVADAFALLICANAEQPAYPGIPGHEPDVVTAHKHARAVERAMKEIRSLVPMAGSYVAESDYFEAEWQRSFWGQITSGYWPSRKGTTRRVSSSFTTA